uniref:Yippee domain-containing protein n=1 Tax=Caenorhabditis tropicalis TaxID=1561998 RepID=A0A1I7UH08_9PELO
MGLKFFENNGGQKMFYCAVCHIYLADKAALVSTSFTGVTGQAYLFSRAANLVHGEMAQRQMMTGHHFVRDVYCGSCNEHLGWMYEKAPEDKEKYKEGSVILERLHIIESEGITKASQMDRRAQPRQPPRRQAMLAELERINQENPRPVDRRRQLIHVFRRQHLLDIPYFMTVNNEIPQIRIHDEEGLIAILGDRTMEVFRRTLRRFNLAITRCIERNNNRELEDMGFRPDLARNYRELQALMDGEPYQPTAHADRALIDLFQRMQQERDRIRVQEMEAARHPPPQMDRNEARREFIRAHRRRAAAQEEAQPPRDPDQPPRGGMAAMAAMMDDQELDLMIRQRMEEFRVNVADPAVIPAFLQEQNRRIQQWENMVGVEDDDEEEVDVVVN